MATVACFPSIPLRKAIRPGIHHTTRSPIAKISVVDLPVDYALYTFTMNIDLIALDLDDTLLHDDLTVSDANRRVLAEAGSRGVRIVLASGRNIHSMRHYAALLGLDAPGDFLICSNGAEIFESDTGKVMDRRLLPPGLCRSNAAPRRRGVRRWGW